MYTQRVLQRAAAANGNGESLNTILKDTATCRVSGTFSATVNFEAQMDDSNWNAIEAVDISDSTSKAATATAAGVYRIDVTGIKRLRARVSGYASGSVTVMGYAE